ncbi:DUF6239 family natural product biosynthesis protein [Labedaea rhizosphaerae]|uniref:Uncharacterized protein n=1 Tax=Labedaea rhizosphaerae TaxID=598644 RepID=A0A4R6SHL1_LABRH|nr:DUF6239 family natural product biosynthesis protein [Labedaea rhizosphaerae]TDQ00349.1 hypothetical protein EV186_102210 [Labedaea rhizosphaerae]
MSGHDHHLSLPVTIGPLALRVLLMFVVPAIAGFAVLRGFLPEPGKRERAALAIGAAVAVLVELMLATSGLRVPDAVVPVLLAGIAVPLRIALARKEQPPSVRRWLDRIGGAVLLFAAVVACLLFVRGWGTAVSARAVALHVTGVVVGIVGLVWYATSRLPAAALSRLATQAVAVVLALGTLGGAAQALALTLPDVQPRYLSNAHASASSAGDGWLALERSAH